MEINIAEKEGYEKWAEIIKKDLTKNIFRD